MRTFFLLLSVFCLPGVPSARAGEGTLFPAVHGWSLAPPPGDSVYNADNLWDIIDGAAELFLSYGFVDLHIGEYTDPGGTDVRVEVYRHSSRTNAFGIYSQERNAGSQFMEIGSQGYMEEKVLNFLCGVFYVKISSHREGRTGMGGMLAIARAVAEHLNQQPGFPPALSLLPAEGRLPNSEAYIAENFLGYKSLHSAFVARYGGDCRIFIMEFENPSLARSAAESYLKAAGSGASLREGEFTEVADPHNGPVELLLEGESLRGAFGSGARDAGLRYLRSGRAGGREQQR